jgi:hypothetical protein
MTRRLSLRPSRREREHGQILILFALALTAMLIALALLFDGARALVLKRELQNAADSAALAAANLIQGSLTGCSSNNNTTARQPLIDAAKGSVGTNLGWSGTKLNNVVVSCPTSYDNYAVKVTLNDTSKTYFGGVAGIKNIGVGASGIAYNGTVGGSKFSVMQLNPGPPTTASWSNATKGCPSVTFAGSAKLSFEGSIQVDSACVAASGGAFGVNGNASVICFGTLNFTTDVCTTNGTMLRMVGSWTQGPNIVTPSPSQFQPYVPDPLKAIHSITTTGWTHFGNGNGTTIGNGSNAQCSILTPGVYDKGITIKAQGSAYFLPGIYVIGGSGINLQAQGSIYTIKQSLSSTNCNTFTPTTSWDTGNATTSMCPDQQCGALIYNTAGTGGSSADALGQLALGGGSGIKLRAFVPSLAPTLQWTSNGGTCTGATGSTCSGGWLKQYQSIVFWQDRLPLPTSSYAQPSLSLRGGGDAFLAGTVYAPSALVTLGGNCGGGGGIPLELTLQFISWDLGITGSCNYDFKYNADAFARFQAYGLIE